MSNIPLLFQNSQEIKKLKKDRLDADIVVPIISDNVNISNYAPFGNSYYYKTGTRVCVHLGLKVESSEWEKLFDFPVGYRPYGIVQKALCGSTLMNTSGLQISPDGKIFVQTNVDYVSGDFEFDAFN